VDWPTNTGIQQGSGDDGLEVGVMVTIILVCCIVGAMLGFVVLRSIRRRRAAKDDMDDDHIPSFRRAGLNAPKDHSEALNIDMDGSGFREAMMSSGSKGTSGFSFEVDSEVGSPKLSQAVRYDDNDDDDDGNPPPPPPPSSSNGSRNGGGGSRNGSVGSDSARNSWGGQML
jgi:hypothetical protein